MEKKQKIIPYMWFDSNAKDAVDFYVSAFDDSKITGMDHYDENSSKASGMPEGSVLTVTFFLEGQEFGALNGGPIFKFSPAISYFVSCGSAEKVDRLWKKLSKGGKVLMELSKYPFSDKFGWLEDRYGVSWQLDIRESRQKISPFLMFTGKQFGKAEAAMKQYMSLFKESRILELKHDADKKVQFSKFSLAGQDFMAIDSGIDHKFNFTPAISFLVRCRDQKEVDMLWDKLKDGGAEEQCGWLKDRYGVSWQIVPERLEEMLADKDPEKVKKVMKAMLEMVKLDIKGFEEAYRK